jgi:hypothetical protein
MFHKRFSVRQKRGYVDWRIKMKLSKALSVTLKVERDWIASSWEKYPRQDSQLMIQQKKETQTNNRLFYQQKDKKEQQVDQ